MLKYFYITLISLLLSFAQAKDVLTFAPLPMESVETVYTQFFPMVNYLEKKLNKKIEIIYDTKYNDILNQFKKGEIDIVYLGPLPYLFLKDEYRDAIPLVHFNNSLGKSNYSCSLVTFIGNKTDIKKIKNKKIALTQPLSTCGYLSVNALLNNHGDVLEENKYKYLGRHDKVALSIIRGEFDFGGVKTSIAEKYANLGLKEVSKTFLYPTFSLVANASTISKETISSIKQILLGAKKDEYQYWGENIRYGCKEANNENFDDLRKLKGSTIIPNKGNF